MGSDIERLVKCGLCAGCGLCEGMAGEDRIKMTVTQEGRMRPAIQKPLDSETSRRILAVCPGKTVTGPDSSQLQGSKSGFMHPVFGPLRSWHRGWSANPDVRWRAAAGGSLTTLASFLLETGRVQKVLHVRASKADPTQTDALISSTPEEVASGCQSRYGPAAPLVHVCRLLDEGITFAVVAKPCDVSAIRALGKLDQRVQTQIPYLLSIFCGGLPSRNAVVKIAARHGVKEDDIGVCRYRGHGWPGLLTIGRRSDGKEFGTTYTETWQWGANPLGPDAGLHKYDIQWRCKICPDAIGEMADVACPDGWLYDSENKRFLYEDGDDPGQNLVLARTAVGEALVRDCADAGRLVLAPLTIQELEGMHADHFPRKTSWPLKLLASWLLWQPVTLSVSKYRPWQALYFGGFWAALRSLKGTLSRLWQHANIEPTA